MPTTRSPRRRTEAELIAGAGRAVEVLRQALVNGLNPAYLHPGDFYIDFWPSFMAWDQVEAATMARAILANAEWRAVARAFDVTILQPQAVAEGLDIWGAAFFDCTIEGGLMATAFDWAEA